MVDRPLPLSRPSDAPAPLVGILAGMGPRSTAPFLDLVIRECRLQYGARDDQDFPPLLVYSLPTPFFPDRPLDHEAMESTILGGLRKLEAAGARFLAMPCNTAHLYYDALARSIDVPLLHIVEETLAALGATTRSVALLATRSTAESGLYREPLRATGIERVERPSWQERITGLIRGVKDGEPEERLLGSWHDLLEEIRDSGAGALVIACTDLRPLVDRGTAGLPAFDSSLCLARSVVRRFLREREAPGPA